MADNETQVETPQPQVETPEPKGGDDAMVPSYRLREEGQKRSDAERMAKEATERLTAVQAEYEALKAQHSTLNLRYESDISMQKAGIEDPEVQGFVRERYQASMKDAPEKKAFAEWFAAQQESPSPILQPFLKKPEPPPVPADTLPAPTKKVPNPEQGIGQPSTTSRDWTVAMIKRVRAENNGGLGPYKDEILSALSQGRVK